MLSFARLVSGPAIGHLIITNNLSLAVPCLLASALTDWLDGYIARRTKTVNILGSYLDPLADKVLVGSVVVSMGVCGMLDGWLFGLIVGRDVAIVGGSFALRFKRFGYRWPEGGWTEFFNLQAEDAGTIRAGGASGSILSATGSKPEDNSSTKMNATRPAAPLYVSKVNTVAQLGLVSAVLMNAWVGSPPVELVTTVLAPTTAVTTVVSGLAYVDAYRKGNIRI